MYIYTYFPIYLPTYILYLMNYHSHHLHACLPTYLPSHPPTYLPTRPPTYLPTYLPTSYLPTYPPTYLTHIPLCLSVGVTCTCTSWPTSMHVCVHAVDVAIYVAISEEGPIP